MSLLSVKAVSPMTKALLSSSLSEHTELGSVVMYPGERYSFQILHTYNGKGDRVVLKPSLSGAFAKYVRLRRVTHVPVTKPLYPERCDSNYISDKPGLYPDILEELSYDGSVVSMSGATSSLWVDVELPCDFPAGSAELCIRLSFGDSFAEVKLDATVASVAVPENGLIFTQWFYCDCLAEYYNLPVFSDRHFEIIEEFARIAVKNGVNMLLTPTFTPPLDTAEGGERLTTQLVGVRLDGGEYSFDFSLLGRWIDMCDRVGIKYLEIAHLFTQWGAAHAPKVIATVDGEEKKIFGWETEATGEEYKRFLRAYLPALIEYMKGRGDDKRCFFHISDEPHGEEQIKNYSAAKSMVKDILSDYVIMDAVSDFSIYEQGILDTPIPSNDRIKPFLEAGVKNLWTYYCCSQCKNVSNRFIAMPACRNRSIGMQLYKFDIVGFLHWGYNFYNNQFSVNPINPFTENSGEGWVPAGDPFSVYPGKGGVPLESTRLLVFADALRDLAAMRLCESLYSKSEVVEAIENVLGYEISFDRCARSESEILAVRARLDEMILKKCK